MQKLYWRPVHVSRVVHLLVAVIAIAALFSAERFQVSDIQPDFEAKLSAAKQMQLGIDVLRTHRVRNVAAVDIEVDPTGSGLVGIAASSTTTTSGSLEAKRTTINPNWGAVLVDLLRQAGVERGDLIAVGVSGSFPALNLAAFVAAEELDVEVVSIASAGASSWGANFPGFSWLDMETVLTKAGVMSQRSVAASVGGTRDRGIGMSAAGRDRLRKAVERSGATFLDTRTDESSIEVRMRTYAAHAQGRRFAAYVNSGGSLVSIGPKSVKRLYRPGLNRKPHPRSGPMDSVMMRFLRNGVPVINLSKILPLAEQYGLPIEPEELPPVGVGTVFEKRQHNRPLVAGLLVALLVVLYGLLKLELGSWISVLTGSRRNLERQV
jgi:poly-gamma-glutamate system protein